MAPVSMLGIVLCPLAVEWGDVATWVAGIATTLVGLLAWLTSRKATAISKLAVEISEQQHKHHVSERTESARIIGRLLLNEIMALPGRLQRDLRALAAGVPNAGRDGIVNGTAAAKGLQWSSEVLMPGAEMVESRIHHLPDALGADLATLIGASRTARSIALEMNTRFSRSGKAALYAGNLADFAVLGQAIMGLAELSIQFEAEFRAYVGIPLADRSSELAALSELKSSGVFDDLNDL